MKPEVKKFDRSRPCSKVEIWNTFMTSQGFTPVQVDRAHAGIGVNAPRVMVSNKYLTRFEENSVEYYALTEAGEMWLEIGTKRYLRNHPNRISEVKHLPRTWTEIRESGKAHKAATRRRRRSVI